MKKITYKTLGYLGVYNHETNTEETEECFVLVEKPYSEDNEAIAKREAHNGEYVIVDDGAEETAQLAQEERITELEESMELLLSGVTE